MSLTQADRIAISKKIVQIPIQDAIADSVIAQLAIEKVKAEAEDLGNKNLMDQDTTLINLYQAEVQRYDGTGRTQLLEQDVIDAADKELQNFFFPNDASIPLPNVPDGIWKQFQAFSGSKAIGKNYDESYMTVTNEQDLITAINAAIAVVEGFSDITRSSGQACTPGFPDTIDTSAAMQTAGSDLITSVLDWETLINGTYSAIPTGVQDVDPTRSAQNDAARADITNTISVIDTWQALADYDTGHGQTTCAGFNSYDVSLLGPTKFRAAELQVLKDEITARSSFVTTRIAQINGYLGSVNQNFSTGEIVSASGFYGKRFRFIEMRLNLIGGSLNKVKSLENGQNAQQQIKNANVNTTTAYADVIVTTAFRAPAGGTGTIHVLDAGDFSISDSVYVVAENQEEIPAIISNITGNTVFLDTNIPKKYRQNEFARLYKDLT